MAQKPSDYSKRLIRANKENDRLHRFLDVVKLKIKDLEDRVAKLERGRKQ
jgi:hypothetical protein